MSYTETMTVSLGKQNSTKSEQKDLKCGGDEQDKNERKKKLFK